MKQQTLAHSTGHLAGRSRAYACPVSFAAGHVGSAVTTMTYWGTTANPNTAGTIKRPARPLGTRST